MSEQAAAEAAPEPSTELANVHVISPQSQAIERAAEAALAMPGVPGRDEFMSLAMQARILSMSGAAPPAIREDPYIAFHVAMVGRDLGISPSAALALIDVIQGKQGPQLSLSPQLLNGQIRRLGLGSITPVVQTVERCVAAALAPNGHYDVRCKAAYPEHVEDCGCRGVLGTTEFGWDEARMAKLVGQNCQPGQHAKSEKCGCNFGYITYPKRMHWWRASGYAADDYFPEAGLGLYTAEELGAVVDDEGRPIDPANVDLPEGYGPTLDRAAPPSDDPPADPADLWDLQLRIRALPDTVRAELKKQWQTNTRVAGHNVWQLTSPELKVGKALVDAFEAVARKEHEWDAKMARDTVTGVVAAATAGLVPAPDVPCGTAPPAQDAQEPPEAAPAPESPSEPIEPPGSTPEPPGEQPTAPTGEPVELPADLDELVAAVSHAPPELVDRMTDVVKGMKLLSIDRDLKAAGQPSAGTAQDRRVRMVCLLVARKLADPDYEPF